MKKILLLEMQQFQLFPHIKKSLFGLASIAVSDSNITLSDEGFLNQEGSSGWDNEKPIMTVPFNTNDYYNNTVPNNKNR